MANEFHDLLTAHLPRLRAYAIMLTRDRAAADDLLQETALRALRAQDQFTLGTNFNAWVYRILRNEHLSTLRRTKRRPVALDEVSEDAVSQNGAQEDQVLTREVVQALEQLQPAQREALILICASGLSYEEAAEALQCSVGTVKSRLWRARRHMQALVLGESVDVKDADADHEMRGAPGMHLPSPAISMAQRRRPDRPAQAAS